MAEKPNLWWFWIGGFTLLALFHTNSSVIVLGFLGLAGWLIKEYPSRRRWGFFIVMALFFTFGEVIATNLGIWTYANPTALGVPYWLPLLWGVSLLWIMTYYNQTRRNR